MRTRWLLTLLLWAGFPWDPPRYPRPAPFPTLSLLLLGGTYVGLLIIFASTLARRWSAMASLIMGYLVFIAPVLLGLMAYTTWRRRYVSRAHDVVLYASTSYFLLLALLMGFAYLYQ